MGQVTMQLNLHSFNSITKYPSILTYHRLDPRNGRLLEDRTFDLNPYTMDGNTPIIVTEKIDGTNARIIYANFHDMSKGVEVLGNSGYYIGSREELLYYSGDLLYNPSMNIVENVMPFADHIDEEVPMIGVTVLYGELYGGKTTANSKQYTGSKSRYGFRLFDSMSMPLPEFTSLMHRHAADIAGWRDNGGQPFVHEAVLLQTYGSYVDPTPRIATVKASELPITIQDTYDWLTATLTNTQAALDEQAGMKPEGVVIRTSDRKFIAKIRLEDYERTLRSRK